MPYISTATIKERRKLIRKTFPDFKISVRADHGSSIHIAILEGPLDLVPTKSDAYEQINHFYIAEHYADFPEKRDFLLKLYAIANKGNYTESVDGDYGNIPSFYTHIEIGNWDRPYILKRN